MAQDNSPSSSVAQRRWKSGHPWRVQTAGVTRSRLRQVEPEAQKLAAGLATSMLPVAQCRRAFWRRHRHHLTSPFPGGTAWASLGLPPEDTGAIHRSAEDGRGLKVAPTGQTEVPLGLQHSRLLGKRLLGPTEAPRPWALGLPCGQEGAMAAPLWGRTPSRGVCEKTALAAVWGQEDDLGDGDRSPGGDDKSLTAAGAQSGKRG